MFTWGKYFITLPLFFIMKKVCMNCGQTLSEDEFYKTKNMCIYCYKRKMRREKRIEAGRPIKTVAELMAELRSLPGDAKVLLFDDITVYRPVSIEFVRTVLKNTKYDTEEYNNTVIID